MKLNYNIPMHNETMKGILQDMLSKNMRKNINFESNPDSSGYSPEQVLYDNRSYFSSKNNLNLSDSFLIVGFKDRVIYPSGYIIRSLETVITYVRGWDLLGSLDKDHWVIIHQMADSDALENYRVGRYEISGGPFRYLKIVHTAPNLQTAEYLRYKMRLSYLEFFGLSWNKFCTVKIERRCNRLVPLMIALIYSI